MDPISKARLSDNKERSQRGQSPNSQANLKKYQPGQSGNPGGRKKKVFTAICDKFIKKNRGAIEETMLKILQKEGMAAVLLLREVADHHEGPVTQSIEVSTPQQMSDEQLVAEFEKLIKNDSLTSRDLQEPSASEAN